MIFTVKNYLKLIVFIIIIMIILGCNREFYKRHTHEKLTCYHTETELTCYDRGYSHTHSVEDPTHVHTYIEHEYYKLYNGLWVEM